MTQFRFRYKCMSYRRWRCRAGRRRTTQLLMPVAAMDFALSAAWRPAQPLSAPLGLRMGEYLIGEDGDLLLYGHPNIRY